MQEMLDYFQYIINFHWGTNWYQWLFYAGIILVIIFERDRIAKSVFGWFPVLFLIGIFNPIFYRVIFFVWNTPYAYYARMFSFIPLFFCIAIGLMQLVKKVKWEWAKLIVVCAASILIIIGGNNFYRAPWMQKSDNIEKIPDGATEVVDILRQDNRVINVAVADPFNVYIRQIDADFITPYGRYMNDLGNALSQEVPNVQYVMIEAGKEAVDYIVVHNNLACKESFKSSGYNPYAETENYLIYAITGVPHTKRIYNEKRQIESETTCDEYENPIENNLGIATVTYEYDANGWKKKETYYNKNGEKAKIYSSQYSSIKWRYRKISGLLESRICLDENDEPLMDQGRYETRYTYSGKTLIGESYFDQNGQPMNRTDTFYASKRISYDDKGRINGEQYFDTVGKPTISSSGYASYTRELDQNGWVLREKYYGIDGQPMLIAAGYAEVVRIYTEDGRIDTESYLDENSRPIMSIAGYSSVRYTYDQNRIREEYFDELGEPVLLSCGYAAYEWEMNGAGGVISETYFGIQGEELGKVSNERNSMERPFQFSHCTIGTNIHDYGSIEINSYVLNNSIDAIWFSLYNASTNEYLLNFGRSEEINAYTGVYTHNLPTGLYILRLNANGTRSDEYIQSLVYMQKGDMIQYNYTIETFEEAHIIIRDFLVNILQSGNG